MFRYLAAVVLCLRHEEAGIASSITENPKRPYHNFTDREFFVWMTNPAKPLLRELRQYHLSGFYQHQFYIEWRSRILQYINEHPNDKLITDRRTYCLSKQLREHNAPVPKYRLVCHIRLEDFCDEGLCMHPDAIVAVMKPLLQGGFAVESGDFAHDEICFVLNMPTLSHEIKYLQYLMQELSPEQQIVIESNDVMMDYHIMRQAEVLICSCSTLSWMAAFMSDEVREVYMPNYPGRPWETFRRPIENTKSYDYTCIDLDTLQIILSLIPDDAEALICRGKGALIPREEQTSGGNTDASPI